MLGMVRGVARDDMPLILSILTTWDFTTEVPWSVSDAVRGATVPSHGVAWEDAPLGVPNTE